MGRISSKTLTKVKLTFTRLQFEDIRLCFGGTADQPSAFDKVKERVTILTDVLILPVQFLDDLDFTQNEEITQAYYITHESNREAAKKGKKSFVQYNFRRKNRPIIHANQEQEESKEEKTNDSQEDSKDKLSNPMTDEQEE